MPRITPMRVVAAYTVWLVLLPASAEAAMEDLLGKYATTKAYCHDAAIRSWRSGAA